MTTISIHNDPTQAPMITEYDGPIGQWLLDTYGDVGIPNPFYLFKDGMSVESQLDLDEHDEWSELHGNFTVCLADVPGGGIAKLFSKIPILNLLFPASQSASSTTRAQVSSNNSLDQRTNEDRLNQRIEDIFGDERATISLLTVPVRVFRNNREYEEFTGCIGRGSYTPVEPPRDGTTPFDKISGAGVSYYAPFTGPNIASTPQQSWGSPVSLRIKTQAQIGTLTGETLTPPATGKLSFAGATATTGGKITMPGGYSGDLTKLYTVGDRCDVTGLWFGQDTAVSNQIQLRSASDTYYVSAVTTNTITLDVGTVANWAYAANTGGVLTSVWQLTPNISEGAIAYLTDQSTTVPLVTYVSTSLTPYMDTVTERTVGPFTCAQTDVEKFQYNLVANSGIFRDTGTVYPFTVSVTLTIEQLDADLNTTGLSTPYTLTISGYRNNPVGVSHFIDNPYPGSPTQHSMLRTTASPSSTNQSVVDDVAWRDLYTYVDDCPDHFGDITMVQVRMVSSQTALKVKSRKANGRVIRNIPAIGQAWGTTLYPLKDMASICSALARDPRIGRLSAAQFDTEVWQLEQARLIEYFGDASMASVTHTFDDTNTTFEESVQLLAAAAFCQAYRAGSSVRVVADLPQEQSTMLFCHRNKQPKTDKRKRSFGTEKSQDGAQVSYKSRVTDAMETYALGINGGSSPSVPKEVEVAGIRTYKQAVIHARRYVNRLKYLRVTQTFDALSDGRLALPTQRVDAVNNTISATQDGEVKAASGLQLTLSQPVKLGAGNHSIILTQRDGSTEGVAVSAVSDDGYTVTLATLPSEVAYTGYMEDRTRFWFGADSETEALAMRVETIIPDSVDKVGMSLVNYSDGYFEGDLIAP